jgi:hypothetical protein
MTERPAESTERKVEHEAHGRHVEDTEWRTRDPDKWAAAQLLARDPGGGGATAGPAPQPGRRVASRAVVLVLQRQVGNRAVVASLQRPPVPVHADKNGASPKWGSDLSKEAKTPSDVSVQRDDNSDSEGVRAYYESTRQARLGATEKVHDAWWRTNLRGKDPLEVDDLWRGGQKAALVRAIRTPDHGLAPGLVHRIWILYWADKYDLVNPLVDELGGCLEAVPDDECSEPSRVRDQALAMLSASVDVSELLQAAAQSKKSLTLDEINERASEMLGFRAGLGLLALALALGDARSGSGGSRPGRVSGRTAIKPPVEGPEQVKAPSAPKPGIVAAPVPKEQGVYLHQLNKGGYEDIITSQRLQSTAAKQSWGGGEAVRSLPGPMQVSEEMLASGRWSGGSTVIEFTTTSPGTPTRYMGEPATYWYLPEGEYLPIRVIRVFYADGTIKTFGESPQ